MKKKEIAVACTFFFMSCVLLGIREGITVKAENNAGANIVIGECVFPDEKFRTYVEEYVDLNQNKILEQNEIDACESLNLFQKGIESLEGIECFTKLKTLNCGKNQLTQLELNGCESLALLDCSKNKITNIDIQKNDNLEKLICSDNQLENLNLQGKNALQYLDCRNNQLQELDLTEVTALKEIYCGRNNIGVMDFTKTPNIISISCGDSQISSLNLQGCEKLELLECDNGKLSSLDVSGCRSLMFLSCNSNEIAGVLDFSGFSKLQTINCNNNKISEIKCDACEQLYQVFCDKKVIVSGVDEQYIYKSEESLPSATPKPDKVLDVTMTPTLTPEAESYSIKYQLKRGKNNIKNPATYTSKGAKLYAPSCKKYNFCGWYLDGSFKNKITEIPVNSKENITLYAKWEKVKVARVTIKSVKRNGTKSAKIIAKKVSGAKGYEISYGQNKKFKNAKKIITSKTTCTIKKLKKGKTYYVRVRAYKYDSANQKVYGNYSKTKKVIIKK